MKTPRFDHHPANPDRPPTSRLQRLWRARRSTLRTSALVAALWMAAAISQLILVSGDAEASAGAHATLTSTHE